MARDDGSEVVLDVDESGLVRPASTTSARRLAAAAGAWRLVAAPNNLMIWQRVGAGADEESQGSEPSVSLAGEVSGASVLADVINFVHFNQWNGSLVVLAGDTRRTIFFQKGQVQTAHSNVPEDRLGALLVRFGQISAADLAACVREVTPQRRLGAILVEKGLMKAHDLFAGVRRQVEEIFFAVLLTSRGAFYFTRKQEPAAAPARLQLDTQGLLLEGLRRIDEMDYFRSKLSGPEVVLARRTQQQPASLTGDPLAVFSVVDGRRTLGEIARDSRLGMFAATKAAFELMQRGLIVVRSASVVLARPVMSFPFDVTDDLLDAYNEALARVQHLCDEAKQPAGLRDAVTAFVSGSERYALILDGVVPDPDGRLPTERLQQNLERLSEEERVPKLRMALQELIKFVLFICHDWIPEADEQEMTEALARAVERLKSATIA